MRVCVLVCLVLLLLSFYLLILVCFCLFFGGGGGCGVILCVCVWGGLLVWGERGGNFVLIKNIHAKRGCLNEFILRTPRNSSQDID